MRRILLVEDEESYRAPLAYQLKREGYEVITATTGDEGLDKFRRAGADLVLLDLMLPGMSGTDVCREIRAESGVPIIMVTAKDTEIDKILGLEFGADDYITKPYSSRELVARVRAVLRRQQTNAQELVTESVLRTARIIMDVERHRVEIDGQKVSFPLREFELLEVLLRNAGRVLTRAQLIDLVWGSDYVGDTKTLDVHIKRLRSKIELDPATPMTITTVRGLGYRLEDE